MSLNSWEKIQELFRQATALPAGDRAAFLARACGDNETLRAEVQTLLEHDSQAAATDFLRPLTPGSELPPPDRASAPEALDAGKGDGGSAPPNDRYPYWPQLEGYQILRELGRGGQGIVYQALQQTTKRKVAIKVLREGPDPHPAAQKRFEREIELVAQLNHPHIIAIFHSGLTPEGRPFYVMDYVDGIPLHQYVRDRRLPLEETLRLFAAVCEGVQYAHQRGIIHRDLKPNNILVDQQGTPRIMDFGLAKQATTAEETLVSISQEVLGTLPYMSPEQAQGRPEALDARTDVYALGVILYELLTGHYPYPVTGLLMEVLKHITETPPTPPSRVWTPDSGVARRSSIRAGLNRSPIDDDVQTIVLKALAKDRERRYQGVDDLVRDVWHYLHGEPIEAKKDSRLYVLGKLIDRHRPAAVAILLLLGGVSALAVQKAITLAYQLPTPILWWNFDEPMPSYAGKHAEQYRSLRRAEGRGVGSVSGRLGNAVYFDGNPDPRAGPISSVNLGRFDFTEHQGSIVLWLRPSKLPGHCLLVKGQTNNSPEDWSLALEIGAQGELSLASGLAGEARAVTGPNAVQVGKWQHLVATWSPQGVSFFVEGQPEALDPARSHGMVRAVPRGDMPVALGRWGDSDKPQQESFKGTVDELMIFDRPLSLREVRAFRGTDPGRPSIAYHWSFEEITKVYDEQKGGVPPGRGYGTVSVGGYRGNALRFREDSAAYVDLGLFDLPEEQGTIALWVRPSRLPGRGLLVKGFTPNRPEDWSLAFQLGPKGEMILASGLRDFCPSATSTEGAVQIGRWQHLVVTWNPSRVCFYVDGRPVPTATEQGQVPFVVWQQRDMPLSLGRWGATNAPAEDYKGEVDELTILDRVVPPGEVAASMGPANPPPPSRLCWHFDETTSSYAERSGRLPAALGQSTAAVPGRFGRAVSLPQGRTAYVELGVFNFHETEGTITMWVRPWSLSSRTGTNTSPLLAKGFGCNNEEDWVFDIYFGKDGEVHTRATWPAKAEYASQTGVIRTGQWQHLALTWSEQENRIYVDGEPVAPAPDRCHGRVKPPSHYTMPVALGRFGRTNNDSPFEGDIDELNVFDRALTQVEIQKVMTTAD